MASTSHTTLISPEVEERLGPLLADLLDQVLAMNEAAGDVVLRRQVVPRALLSFYAFRVPQISVQDYLDRIYQFSCCSPACLIVAMVYIERLVARQLPTVLWLSRHNVHRVVVSAMLLAAKYLEDVHYDNAYWAKIAGISVRELNKLEVVFLNLIDWRLEVTSDEFSQYFWGLLSTDESVAAAQPTHGTSDADEEGEEFFDAPDGTQPTEECKCTARYAEERLSPTRRSYSEDIAKSLAAFRVPCC